LITNSARVEIQNNSQVMPFPLSPDVGDIATPGLIGCGHFKLSIQDIRNVRSLDRRLFVGTPTYPSRPVAVVAVRSADVKMRDIAPHVAAQTKVSGLIQRLWLFRIATIPIVRHVKILGKADPFDPAWVSYFAHRCTATVSD